MSSKDPPEVSERSHLKVFLPRKLVECLPKCPVLPKEQLRWNTNEEIASYLITFEKHDEWLSCSPKTRPQNGSVILYNRKKVKYRKDGYCWKKRKDGKTTREDHMKLKVQGVECLYGCYVHSSIVPTFHRRCYWLLQNPDIVLVHYLNVPAMEECGRPCAPPLCSPPICTPPICAATADPREWLKWSQEELVAQLRPMFHGVKWGCGNGGAPPGLSLEQLVQHVLERHQARPPPRTHACLCAGGAGSPAHTCRSTKHRSISPRVAGGGGGGVPGDAPKPAPSSPDTTQPSPGLGGGAAAPEGPRGGPAFPLPLLVVSGLGGGAAPGGPEQPLGLTPSQHLVTPEGTCPTAPPPPAAFDPDCFLNSPRRGQTYGCEAEAPPGAPPPPPAVPPKPGGGREEEEEEGKPGVTLQDPPCELNVAPPQHPFPLPFPELLGGDAGVPPNPRGDPHEPPPTPHPPPSPPAPSTDPPVAITDFSPEWSYPEGGVKVLITGPWGDPGAYSCLFDRTSVPAALVQPGVLRCYCPPHEAGVAALRVACPPRLLTAAAPFEYRARGAVRGPPGTQMDWLALDETQFRLSILERLEQLETRLGALPPPAPLPPPRGAPSDPPPEQGPGSSFEARVVAVCEAMMARPGWPGTSPGPSVLAHGATFRGMTLLHLAAAQGYAGLVEALRRWRALAVDSLELEQEIDPLNVDHFSCTPLMWACALGHREAAERLCRWDRRALAVPDTLGRLPLALARARGHLALVTRLEELQMSPVSPRCHLPGLRVPSPLSASPDTGLSTASSLSSPSGLSEGPSSVPLPPGPPGPPEDESWGVAVPPSPPEDALAAPTDILQAEVVTLARQIIEATPERIKQEAPGGPPGALGALGAAGGPAGGPAGTPGTPGGLSAAMAWLATYLESVDRPPAPPHRAEAAPRGSPGVPERPPPPSAVGWAEFLNASGGARGEGGAVALLTLSDQEQHELYEAARLVQGAFRKYRGRRLKEQQELAAAVIQRCYRKYKQFALFQRMTQAAILIQSKFRSYAEQKRFQRRRRAAVLIQQRFRSLRQHRSTFLTLKQDQAARKIMRFLRRCRHRMEELKQNKEVDSLQTRGLAS
ncbi:LOW QUALITY PROTEIN: calmodulin-binding transcription activator 2 [Neopelma chrysocephalum]|uniref:LOW QUALITY PROTEIN: calmodulin-binding transcription activator 2 n=1 Tax=Neopelma chrysocephalum TaxID=114329 RepID=UPI000FCD47A9|nr:LOW QUALITY PROTEIN: calmodulin-binding transcription activator 2 [Neopelma chrysocephalum]